MSPCVLDSRHTSVKQRAEDIQPGRIDPSETLEPIAGIGQSVLALTNAQYIELVDWSGRQMYPGKRGKIEATEPRALSKLGIESQRWEHDVKGVGKGLLARCGNRAGTDRQGDRSWPAMVQGRWLCKEPLREGRLIAPPGQLRRRGRLCVLLSVWELQGHSPSAWTSRRLD
jgi:hypothetical protein